MACSCVGLFVNKKAAMMEVLTKNLTREKVKIADVPYYGFIEDKIGYVSLSSFTNTSSQSVGDAIRLRITRC